MKIIVSLILFSVSICVASGQSTKLRKANFNLRKDLALDGYDAVSYIDGKPRKGDSRFKINYKDIVYHFASASNLDRFKANPDKFEPAYGGWCAYAMGASGEKVKVDPETFKVIEGRVYLYYNFWGNNTLESWNKEEKKLKQMADHNWSNIVR
jgi:YHS domain-containing protein